MTTVFKRLGDWATDFFSTNEMQVIAADIEAACEIVKDEAPKVEAFISMLLAALATLKSKEAVQAAQSTPTVAPPEPAPVDATTDATPA